MKRFILLLMIMCTSIAMFAQEPYTITEVVKSEDLSADDLYKNAKDWIIKTFIDAQEVIQYDNREEGEIQIKAVMEYSSPVLSGSAVVSGYIRYMLIIQFKEGRYKYEFTNFVHSGTNSQFSAVNFGLITTEESAPKIKGQFKGWCQKQWDHIKRTIDKEVFTLMPDMKYALQQKPQNDEW